MNGKTKTTAGGFVGIVVAALAALTGTEATGQTSLLGGLSREQVLEICATPEALAEVMVVAGAARLSQLCEAEARARQQLDQAIKADNQADRRWWQAEVRRIQAEIRKLEGS